MNEKIKHYFGIVAYKITDGFSIGSCLTYDKELKELYIFVTLGLWQICIGWLSKEIDEE